MFWIRTTALLAFFVCLLFVGCGGGSGTTVVEPGQDYQPTPEEQAMQQEMESTRDSAKQ